MSTYRGTVGAADAAVPLATVSCDVDHHISARVAWIVSRIASMEPVHAARGQMQCGAHAGDDFEDVRETLVLVPVVEVPAFMIVISQLGVGGGRRELLVEQVSATSRNRFVDNSQPLVDDRSDGLVIAQSRLGEGDLHSVLARSRDDSRAIVRPVVRERRGEKDRIFTVRVEMHNGITSC